MERRSREKEDGKVEGEDEEEEKEEKVEGEEEAGGRIGGGSGGSGRRRGGDKCESVSTYNVGSILSYLFSFYHTYKSCRPRL
jgi:hypothetical protein